MVRHLVLRQRDREHRRPTGTRARNSIRGPGAFNIDASLVKSTRIGRYETELRVEAFNVLNHAQFALPNGQLGSPQFGVVTAMLASPSCAFCGTIERQIQIAAKVRF